MMGESGWIRAKANYGGITRAPRVATVITGLSFQQLLHILKSSFSLPSMDLQWLGDLIQVSHKTKHWQDALLSKWMFETIWVSAKERRGGKSLLSRWNIMRATEETGQGQQGRAGPWVCSMPSRHAAWYAWGITSNTKMNGQIQGHTQSSL